MPVSDKDRSVCGDGDCDITTPNRALEPNELDLTRAEPSGPIRSSVPLGTQLRPGDTIVVPDKSVKPSALRGFLAIPAIFSQVMYGVAAERQLPECQI